jgi:PEP-CTERM motif
MHKALMSCALTAALTAALQAPAQAAVVYSNNFDSAAVVAGGVTANFTGAGALQATTATYTPTYGQIYRSNSSDVRTQITLSNLPTHNRVDLNFFMAFLDSWDSRNGSPSPDNLDLYIDGVLRASYTFNTASGTVRDFGGGTLLASDIQFDVNVFFADAIVDMAGDPGLDFAHTSSTLTVDWVASGNGWQGGNDEAYGLDNISIDLRTTGVTVPEPGSLALVAASLGGLMLARRRKA